MPRRETEVSEGDAESGERGSGPQIHVPVSAFANVEAQPQGQGRIDGETWMRRRPGATFFEKVQVRGHIGCSHPHCLPFLPAWGLGESKGRFQRP